MEIEGLKGRIHIEESGLFHTFKLNMLLWAVSKILESKENEACFDYPRLIGIFFVLLQHETQCVDRS